MSELAQLSDQYCIILKRCLQYYHEKSTNKSASYAHIRRGLLFVNDFPIDAMKMTGVKLWKYKHIVNGGDLGEIKSSTTKKVRHVDTPETQDDIADSVVETVEQTWQRLEKEEKDAFTEQIKEMLKIYTKILLLEKTGKSS